jgi:hypothetical protein
MNLEQERMNILSQAVETRRREIMHYQINIDNYEMAIAEIERNYGGNADMVEFAEHLKDLLASSVREQTKEQILLMVIEKQLEVADVG